MTSIEIGNDLRVKVAFSDEDDLAVDPTAVFLDVTLPEGSSPAVVTYEYGMDSEVVRDGAGEYSALIFADIAGQWSYTWRGSGPVRGQKTTCFTVTEGCGEG